MIRASELGSHIDACIFDFDGTLYLSSAGIEKQIKARFRTCAQKRLGLSEHEVKRLLHEYRQKYHSSVLGLQKHHDVDPFEFYEELYSGLDISNMKPKPRLSEVLRHLSSGIPLYILSNSNRTFVQRSLVHLGLEQYLTEIFTVEDNGFIRKPQESAYFIAIKRIGIDPSRVCMFDDIASSLQAAKRVGLVTILIGNGISDSHYVDLHTSIHHAERPSYCDFAAQDIAEFIGDKFLTVSKQ